MGKKEIKIALLNLYNGTENQGIRCIREIIDNNRHQDHFNISVQEFDIRLKLEPPPIHFDIFISSGGPGSPLKNDAASWEKKYFAWLADIMEYNQNEGNTKKKSVFFICHSFQLACRYFEVADVVKRKSTSFGVFPIHSLAEEIDDSILHGLPNPFFAVDNRDYQVVKPNHEKLNHLGAKILAIEKERTHVPFERAIMAIRFNQHMAGSQFHPEADTVGMRTYLHSEEKKEFIIEHYGREKWQSMLDQLDDPDKIMLTHRTILPNFLNESIAAAMM